jgi:hypothetical protein
MPGNVCPTSGLAINGALMLHLNYGKFINAAVTLSPGRLLWSMPQLYPSRIVSYIFQAANAACPYP